MTETLPDISSPGSIIKTTSPAASTANAVFLPREWPYRMLGNALVLGLIFFLASITITIKTDLINKKLLSLQDSFFMLSGELGFTVDDIILEGRIRTSASDILDALKINRQSNILELDLIDIKQKIESLPWVKSAIVKRTYFPNTLHIGIKEHQVKSLWQYNEQFHPIDEDGNVINTTYTPSSPLLLIVGKGAPENINKLLSIIEHDSEIFPRIKVANYISERRWDLILDNIQDGITIKLPEDNIDLAWKKLIKLNSSKNILKRKLTNVDLRLQDKVIVKLEKTSKKNKNTKESKI